VVGGGATVVVVLDDVVVGDARRADAFRVLAPSPPPHAVAARTLTITSADGPMIRPAVW
jgi:hypothetical protein